MPIYLLFIQHIIKSLSEKGKAAIVVPTGFLTAQNSIEVSIKKFLVENKILRGVVSMPSNIFATTSTNVSILFLDKIATDENVLLMDASKLGKKIKEGKNQKTILSKEEEDKIIDNFNKKENEDGFSVLVNFKKIGEMRYSLSAGQFFKIENDKIEISELEFFNKIEDHNKYLVNLFQESKNLENEILIKLNIIAYEKNYRLYFNC